jgi:AcrR family transcriptional regulator
MARPRTVDDAVVLAAAAEVVNRVGPSRLTLQRVADEVGLSAPTLVQRFGSKRGLLLAMGEQAASGWPEVFATARSRTGSALDALVEALVDLTAHVATPEALANSIAFLQIDLSDPEFHERTVASMRRMRELMAELLDEAVEAGDLPRGTDTGALAGSVMNAYNGALVSWAIFREGTLADWLRRELRHVLSPAAERR